MKDYKNYNYGLLMRCVDMNPPEGNAWTLQQHSVVLRNLLGEVRQQGDVNVAQTSSLTEHDIMGASVTFDNYVCCCKVSN